MDEEGEELEEEEEHDENNGDQIDEEEDNGNDGSDNVESQVEEKQEEAIDSGNSVDISNAPSETENEKVQADVQAAAPASQAVTVPDAAPAITSDPAAVPTITPDPAAVPTNTPDPAAAAAAAAAAITAAATVPAAAVATVPAAAVATVPAAAVATLPTATTTLVPGIQPFSFSAPATAALPQATDPAVVTITMAVPPDKVGVLIGSKGAIIHDMQAKCGCKMFVKQEGIPEGLPRELIITGVPEKIEEAKALAIAVMEEGPIGLKTTLTGQPLINFEMDCSASLVGRVIGAQGATIKDLQLKSGAKIHVNQDFPEGMPRKVLIAGTQDCVNNAIRMVQLVMEHGPAGLATVGGLMGQMPPNYSAPGYGQLGAPSMMPQMNSGLMLHVMECPKQVVGKLIGRGGETIQLIQQKSGCKVQIDQQVPEGHPCKINMNGNTQAIQNAIQIVQEIMTNGVGRVQNMPPMPSVTAGLTSGYSVPGVHHHPQGIPNTLYGGQFAMQQQRPQQYAPPIAYSMPQGYQQPQYMQQAQYVQSLQAAAPVATAPVAAAIPKQTSPWTEHTADGGHKYWYNASTGVSTWERPAGF